MNAKYYNRNFKVVVETPGYRGFLGFAHFVELLDYSADKVLSRLMSQTSDKLVLKPFHGLTVISYLK